MSATSTPTITVDDNQDDQMALSYLGVRDLIPSPARWKNTCHCRDLEVHPGCTSDLDIAAEQARQACEQ